MAVGIVELVGRAMPELVLDPADSRARVFQRLHAPLQRLRTSRAERGMPEAGGVPPRQLQAIALVIVPAAQIDRVSEAPAFGHPEHVDEEREAALRRRRQEFDMTEMGDVHDRFVGHWFPPSRRLRVLCYF